MIFDQAKNYAILGLIGALAIGGGYHWSRVTYLQAKVEALTNERDNLQLKLDTVIAANDRLANALHAQNEATQEYLDATAAAKRAAEVALVKARADASAWRKKYEKILSEPPANPSDLCGSLDLRLSQYIEQRAGEAE